MGLKARTGVWIRALVRPHDTETLPVLLHRRRVYVLPTRFGLFYAVLLVAMLLGALNYNNNPALLLGLLLAGGGLASLVAAQLQLTGLQVTAVEAEPVPAGSELVLRLHARAGDGRERRGLRISREGGPGHTALLSLDRGEGEARLEIPTTRRGWLPTPRLKVATTRPLGIARAWGLVWPSGALLVYPRPEADGPPLPLGSGDRVQHRLHASGDDVHHLRNYRTGDSRRTIAWKASARRDTLLVREYEEPLGADVVLDWQATGPIGREARISRMARWVDEAERDGRRYRLLLPGQPPIGPERGPHHRHACLRALALMPDERLD